MGGSARKSIVEKVAFWGSSPLRCHFSMAKIFSTFVFCNKDQMDSEDLVSLQNFDIKFFPPLNSQGSRLGVIFPINLAHLCIWHICALAHLAVIWLILLFFFGMSTRYLHRICSLFHRSQQKIFPSSEGPRLHPMGLIFLMFVFVSFTY